MAESKKEELPGCSVVTVNSGRSLDWLSECRASVRASKTKYPFEHVVIDNIGNTKTIGEAYNEGVRRSKYPFFLILDDDDVLHDEAIEHLMTAMLDAKKVEIRTFRAACHQLLLDERGDPIATTNHPCQGLFDKEAVLALGGYPSVPWSEYKSALIMPSDLRMTIHALQEGMKQVVLPATLYGYRIHRKQASFLMNQEGYEDILWQAKTGKNVTADGVVRLDWAVDISERPSWIEAMKYQEKWVPPPPGTIDTTVGIITYNNEKEIATVLKALNTYTQRVHLIVIDNGSTDSTREVLRSMNVSFIEQENVGFPAAVNQLMEQTETEYLVLLNPDVIVQPNWLQYLKACMERHFGDKCAMVGCRMVLPDGALWHEGAGFDKNGEPVNLIDLKWKAAPHDIEVEAVTFALALIRKELFKKLRCDLDFGTGLYEDVDYAIRARKLGYTVWYTPYVTCVHKIHSSWDSRPGEIDKQGKRNMEIFLNKHGKQTWSNEWLRDKL